MQKTEFLKLRSASMSDSGSSTHVDTAKQSPDPVHAQGDPQVPGILKHMLEKTPLQRTDSIEDFLLAFSATGEPTGGVRKTFDEALKHAGETLLAMRLIRSNRPDIAQRRRADPATYKPSKGAAEIYQQIDRLADRLPWAGERRRLYDAWAELHLTAYAGSQDHEADCDAHAALTWGILRKNGVPASKLVPLACAGFQQAGGALGHALLLYSDVDFPGHRPMSCDEIIEHIRNNKDGCLVVDFWSKHKCTPLSTGDALVSVLEERMKEVHPRFEPSTLVWLESMAGI